MRFAFPQITRRQVGERLVRPSHYVLLSTLFFVGLELIFALHRWVGLLMTTLLVIVAAGIILVRAEERGKFHPIQVILPLLAAIGLTGLALFLPTTPWIHIYFVASAIVLLVLLKHGVRQAYPTWNWAISVIILFINVAAVLGWRFHLYAPILIILPLVWLIMFLISLQALNRVTPSLMEASLLATAMGFVLTEIVWVLQFLPLHYLVQTGIVGALYYVSFHLISVSYERTLSRKDIIEYATVGVLALLLILLTAQWT